MDELKNKNCIFIYPKNFKGEKYDFAVLYPKEEIIILIQAEYKLTKTNVKKRSEYADATSVNIITNSISKNYGINIQTIYLLYISSFEYNYSNKDDVFEILNSYQIKCIFYSIKEDTFTYDFKYIIDRLSISNSMEIYPDANYYWKYDYIKQNNPEELLESLVNLDQQIQNDNAFIKGQYKKFLEYLNKTNIKKELKSHFGEFEIFSDNYRLFPEIYFDIYLLFFKVIKNFSLKDNNEYKNYLYAIGKWRIEQEINLDEEKDVIK